MSARDFVAGFPVFVYDMCLCMIQETRQGVYVVVTHGAESSMLSVDDGIHKEG